jgi:mono/diheme cytochrome c family protein
MNWTFYAGLTAVVLLLAPINAHARGPGNPQRGRVLAEGFCTSCHGIDASSGPSTNLRAPPFTQLAQTPGMTAIALRAALQTSHKTMPNLMLRKRDREDVIAYILSLKISSRL